MERVGGITGPIDISTKLPSVAPIKGLAEKAQRSPVVPRTSPREVGLRGEKVSRGHLPFGSVVPVPHGWQPGDRKAHGRDVSQQPLSGGDKLCSPTLPSISPTADPTDLIQTALIGLPLVFVGLGKC